MPIRYMGTKRHMVHRVQSLVADLKPRGKVLDLFSGVGCVAESLAGISSVVTNDALPFTAVFARARFLGASRELTAQQAITQLREPFRAQVNTLARHQRRGLAEEEQALDGGADALTRYMTQALNVSNSDDAQKAAHRASTKSGHEHYCMATLYFAAGYFGLRQATQLDALRFAIDDVYPEHADRDWLLSAWLSTAATICNAPGHTAQYLKPTSDAAYKRIRRNWRRSVWEIFQEKAVSLKLVGTPTWRKANRVEVSDAIDLLHSNSVGDVGVVYADPPYTRDQYSRYYHVYDTLLRYDFPDALGKGRVRSDRVATDFSLKSRVQSAFTDLFASVSILQVPLVMSYPSSGLLSSAGCSIPGLAQEYLSLMETHTFNTEHSTLGGSQGSRTKTATENLYVFQPI